MNEGRNAGTGLRVRLRSTDLASAPSPAELEAITLAVRQALGAEAPGPASELSSEQTEWRLGARWWAGGVFPRLWTTCGERED